LKTAQFSGLKKGFKMNRLSSVLMVVGFTVFFGGFFVIIKQDREISILREKIEILANRECQECSRRARWDAEQRVLLSDKPM
jgi:hypothetical protein